MSDGAIDIRRLVVIDENERSRVIADGPSPDTRTDPARSGFSIARMWVSEAPPVRLDGLRETLHLPNVLQPPPGGSLCNVVTFPPEAGYRRNISGRQVQDFYAAIGEPAASNYSPNAPHPYMQKTRTLEFALVLSGDITLVLDLEEVSLQAGDTVVLRGNNHAWSNRGTQPCVIAFSVHDGTSA